MIRIRIDEGDCTQCGVCSKILQARGELHIGLRSRIAGLPELAFGPGFVVLKSRADLVKLEKACKACDAKALVVEEVECTNGSASIESDVLSAGAVRFRGPV